MKPRKVTAKKLASSSLLAAGKAICAAAGKATSEYTGPGNRERYSARGACQQAMSNLWYDWSTEAARAAFNYSESDFFTACGWPD